MRICELRLKICIHDQYLIDERKKKKKKKESIYSSKMPESPEKDSNPQNKA